MSIKLTVDNNFFDIYEAYPDNRIKEKIRRAFISKHLSFYPTLELSSELTGLYQTKRKDLLKKYSRLFLDMMDYRFFNEWNTIIKGDIGLLENKKIFLDKKDVDEIKALFIGLSQGVESEDVEKVLNEIKEQKEKRYDKFKKNQDHHFELLKKEGIKTPKMTFEDFFKETYTTKIRKDLVKHLFVEAGKPIEDAKIDDIVDNPTKHPYFYISSRVFMAMFYRHVVVGRKVREGDSFDQYYLIYLANLDYLISEDGGLKELGEDVFGKTKVINLAELIRII